ncbi:MAG: hypothetical protein JSV24_06580 [Bacteroidales bacterium]|nr:MAG: hypothetical protein JSV24_06580 [Bacteroidales bacterium]
MKKENFLNTSTGVLLTLILSVLVLFILFGELLKSPNTVYFAGDGDGLQSYYGTLYHVLHDTTYSRTYGMNHPYGEMVLFTGNQPVIANTVKWISEHIIDISDHTMAIVNLLMLFSIVIAAIILFLILRHFNLPVTVSVILGVAIPFLSPQIGRLGGHFSLTYVFFIPLMIYLFILFYKKRSYPITSFIGMLTLLAAFTHFYFLGFFGLLFVFYWIVLIVRRREEFGKVRFFLPHIFLQFILPVLIVQFFSISFDDISDRTSSPWGILYLRAYPESVFLPVGKPYGRFLDRIMTFNHIDWEGWAYTGFVAAVGFIVVLTGIVRKMIRKEFTSILSVSDNMLLNIFFWASFAGLLYSFGLPFILGLERLLDYMGPLRQMRGIARFSWLFFYVMNILTFYLLWNWYREKKYPGLARMILFASLAFVSYDAWLNSRSMEYYMNNRIPALDDRENKLPENQWVYRIDPLNYQAIIPVPYFHIGSENLWILTKCDVLKHTYIASLKTGLPTTGVLLSRTSIGQSYRNIEMMLEPYRDPAVLADMPNRKPFLILAMKCGEISETEKNLLSESEFLTGNDRFELYSIRYNTLARLAERKRDEVLQEYKELRLIEKDGFMVTDSLCDFYYNGFEEAGSNRAYYGEHGYEGDLAEYNTVFWDSLPWAGGDSVYVCSFWLDNARKDLLPRSTIEFALTDSSGELIHAEYKNLGNLYTLLDGEWALLEHTLISGTPGNKLKITIWNHDLRKEKIFFDELIVRPSTQHVFREFEGGIMKNNRLYYTRVSETGNSH